MSWYIRIFRQRKCRFRVENWDKVDGENDRNQTDHEDNSRCVDSKSIAMLLYSAKQFSPHPPKIRNAYFMSYHSNTLPKLASRVLWTSLCGIYLAKSIDTTNYECFALDPPPYFGNAPSYAWPTSRFNFYALNYARKHYSVNCPFDWQCSPFSHWFKTSASGISFFCFRSRLGGNSILVFFVGVIETFLLRF